MSALIGLAARRKGGLKDDAFLYSKVDLRIFRPGWAAFTDDDNAGIPPSQQHPRPG